MPALPARRLMMRLPADLSISALIVLAIVPLLFWSGASTRHSIAGASAYQQRVREAQVTSDRLIGLQVDEETGLRGFTSTGSRTFLEPYVAGERDYASTFQTALHDATGAGVDVAPLQREGALHARWVATVAEPLLRDPHGARAYALQLAGKALVDGERRENETLQDALRSAAAESARRLDDAVRAVTEGTVVACLLVVALAVAIGFLRRRAMRRIAAERERYEREKRIADALQDAFLQKALPFSPHVGLHAAYIPAEDSARVGGDWYDAFELPDGRLLFSIGDVAGHGLEAAIVMSRARQAILVAALHENDPGVVLERANKAIVLQDGPMVSAICGYVDAGTMEIVYATAGHPAPIISHPGAPAHVLPIDGIVLGADPGATYRTFVAHAQNDGLLVLYTDGVIEHDRDPIGGEQALLRAVDASMRDANPALAIQQAIFRTSRPNDDVAILTLSFRALGDGRARTTVAATHATLLDTATRAETLEAIEVDGDGVGAAENDAHALVRARHVAAGEQRAERGGAAGLDDDARDVPEGSLRGANRAVVHQHDAFDERARDREHAVADAPRCERVGRQTARRRVDRTAGVQRRVQGR